MRRIFWAVGVMKEGDRERYIDAPLRGQCSFIHVRCFAHGERRAKSAEGDDCSRDLLPWSISRNFRLCMHRQISSCWLLGESVLREYDDLGPQHGMRSVDRAQGKLLVVTLSEAKSALLPCMINTVWGDCAAFPSPARTRTGPSHSEPSNQCGRSDVVWWYGRCPALDTLATSVDTMYSARLMRGLLRACRSSKDIIARV